MTPSGQEAAMLAALPGAAFAFMLVLCRAGSVIMLVPGLGEIESPGLVRAGLALSLAVLLLPVVAPIMPASPGAWNAAGMVCAELVAGGALGWLARLPAMALSVCGALVSTASGMTSVVQPDPALGGQSSALARMMGLAAPVLVLSTGLYTLPLLALVESYRLVAPGSLVPSGPLAASVIDAVSAMLAIAVRLSAPFIVTGLLLQAALGLLARLIPQLQVFAIAVPGQIIGGLAILGLLAAPIAATWLETITLAWSRLPGL